MRASYESRNFLFVALQWICLDIYLDSDVACLVRYITFLSSFSSERMDRPSQWTIIDETIAHYISNSQLH